MYTPSRFTAAVHTMVDASVENLDEAISSLDSNEATITNSLKHLRWVLAMRGRMLEGLDVDIDVVRAEAGRRASLQAQLNVSLGRQSIEPMIAQRASALGKELNANTNGSECECSLSESTRLSASRT